MKSISNKEILDNQLIIMKKTYAECLDILGKENYQDFLSSYENYIHFGK